jgi:glutathione peroxidase
MPAASEQTLSDFEVRSLDGKPAPLAQHAGKVVLVVNTASECGLTPQYAGLEALWREHKGRGLVVLGMPSNDFGGQEPGSAEQIQQFCSSRYEVSFPLHEKCVTKPGPDQSPLYAWLGATTGKLPGWNFGKYLIGRDGRPIEFFNSKVAPDAPELRAAIEAALARPAQG